MVLPRFAIGLGLALGCLQPVNAQSPHCTHDSFALNGTGVTAMFCIPAGAGAPGVTVSQTFVSGGRTLARSITFAVVAGAAISHTIDDVDLGPLGIRRTLHMTLAYRRGFVGLEHALALPGATPVK